MSIAPRIPVLYRRIGIVDIVQQAFVFTFSGLRPTVSAPLTIHNSRANFVYLVTDWAYAATSHLEMVVRFAKNIRPAFFVQSYNASHIARGLEVHKLGHVQYIETHEHDFCRFHSLVREPDNAHRLYNRRNDARYTGSTLGRHH